MTAAFAFCLGLALGYLLAVVSTLMGVAIVRTTGVQPVKRAGRVSGGVN